ncbi:hypothetical protein [Oenococcus sicerae]|uniref:hypothetical protein n=1 Tax=Oenococcus sicerae TaxID=2203724 RepID=UPI0039EAB06C
MLDEPTSNLDKNGIKALTGLIQHFSGIVLTVSHDAEFLDSVTDHVLLIENHQVKLYDEKFSVFQIDYEQARQKEFHLYEVQNKQKNSSVNHYNDCKKNPNAQKK